LSEELIDTVQALHLQIGVQQSDRVGVPGSLITLIAEVRLPREIHVYPPGTMGYKPIELSIDSRPGIELRAAPIYPASKIIFLSAINERVPVFEGTFRIRQDVRISTSAEFSNSLAAAGKELAISGTLRYQACDCKTCFLPTAAPVQWHLKVLQLYRQRVPEDIQLK
jgi:hypothetical protein